MISCFGHFKREWILPSPSVKCSEPHMGGIPVITLTELNHYITKPLIYSARQPLVSDPSITSMKQEVMAIEPLQVVCDCLICFQS